MPPKVKKIPTPPSRSSTRKITTAKKFEQQIEANTSRVMKKALSPKKAGVAETVAAAKNITPAAAKKVAKAQADATKKTTTATTKKSTAVKKTTITKADMAKKVTAAKSPPVKAAAPKLNNKRKASDDADEPVARPTKIAKLAKPTTVVKPSHKAKANESAPTTKAAKLAAKATKPTPAAKSNKSTPAAKFTKSTPAAKSIQVKETSITKAAMAKKAAAAKSAPVKAAAPKSNKRKSTDDVDESAGKPLKKARFTKSTPATKKSTTKAAANPAPPAKKPKAAPKPKTSKVVNPKLVKPKVLKPKNIVNVAPTQLLDIYVFGCNECGELGLGQQTKKDTIARPTKNPDLTALGIVQMAAGGMHGVALTKDNKILTWGVNDGKPLGRDTDEWVAPEKDADADSDDESVGAAQNPLESTPTEVVMTNVPEGTIFTQIAAGDNATYAVTNDGLVYGWGTVRVSCVANTTFENYANNL